MNINAFNKSRSICALLCDDLRKKNKGLKNSLGRPDERVSTILKRYSMADNDVVWMYWAYMVLTAVNIAQQVDGAKDISDNSDVYEEYPLYPQIGTLLAQDGFIRKIEVNDNAMSYRITLKGLALRTVLADILGDLTGKTEEETVEHIKSRSTAGKAYGLLAALNGVSCNNYDL